MPLADFVRGVEPVEYHVALCGLTDHKAHLLQVVVSSAPTSKHKFRVGQPETLPWVDIALVETMSSVSAMLLTEVRRRNPKAVAVFVSDHGQSGDSRYRIARRSLLLQIHRLLEQIVAEEFAGSSTSAAPPSATAPVAARAPSIPPAPALVEIATAPDIMPSRPPPLVALVVDDSDAIREQTRAALQRAGIRSRQAADAAQGMALLEQYPFDLALFDVVMPGMDGYELCRRVKHDPRTRRMPVLMLTSRSSPFDRARGALVGCDSYLVKPITWDSFYQAVEKALLKSVKNDHQALALRGFRSQAAVLAMGRPALKEA